MQIKFLRTGHNLSHSYKNALDFTAEKQWHGRRMAKISLNRAELLSTSFLLELRWKTIHINERWTPSDYGTKLNSLNQSALYVWNALGSWF